MAYHYVRNRYAQKKPIGSVMRAKPGEKSLSSDVDGLLAQAKHRRSSNVSQSRHTSVRA
jgi:hypothetical protein